MVSGPSFCGKPVISGVTQGSVLGPLLFLMFVNGLGDAVTGGLILRFYADETRIVKHIACIADHDALQSEFSAILGWAKRNNMQFQKRKFELLVHRVGPRTNLECLPFAPKLYSYSVSDQVLLSPVDELRDLDVTILADLSWKSQIGSMVANERSSAAWVLSVFKSREPDVMTLYKTYMSAVSLILV